ncbi:hypothetical protein NLX86_27525 [Streptomyces sp. A3M-1-3]|uniref:hypothetical protein n=1 Tax=Streptomyces sp. A3M-1-3 TaxID=2962044 RepID=UPI0020B6AD59|nr:hypothetical protein [Streptomyces sp. A3M-1-3]MCP3821706.1 hypothetical protein [Streptomyces sp. A3M-1-3]
MFREPPAHSLAGQHVAARHGVQHLPRRQLEGTAALGLCDGPQAGFPAYRFLAVFPALPVDGRRCGVDMGNEFR